MALGARQRAAFDGLEAVWRDYARTSAGPSRCPELDCVRHMLGPNVLGDAERRSLELGIGADRVVIATGAIEEETYARALAAASGLTFESLADTTRSQCPLDDERLLGATAAGLLPLRIGEDLILVVAPRRLAARRIIELLRSRPFLASRFRVTTEQRLRAFVESRAADAWADRATHALERAHPELSAGPGAEHAAIFTSAVIGVLGLATLLALYGPLALPCGVMISVLFWAWIIVRACGLAVAAEKPAISSGQGDADLPAYTIIVALYREAVAVGGLLKALRDLDYPRENIDVKLVVEPDDRETLQAIGACPDRGGVEIIVAPLAGPKTKPKALNAALPFARGSYTVVFDAEDRPQSDQLRRALDAFRSGGPELACVQASLTIDDSNANWLVRMFGAEYAAQFDVFLPALSRLGLPLPLGGSSNHFRTHVLRKIGAWDPFNVTEDADLGIRLARFGYRSVAINAATCEEAPAQLAPWLKQRTRWFKGWMQTWLVHMRHPARLYREVGLAGFIAVQLTVGGSVLASLVHPVMMAALLWTAFDRHPTSPIDLLFGGTAIAGYVVSGALGLCGLARRGRLRDAWVLLGLPAHWILLSIAAWRALVQLLRRPYYWEKTAHHLARVPRRTGVAVSRIVGLNARERRDGIGRSRQTDRRSRPIAASRAGA